MRNLLICTMLIASPAFAGQVFKCKDTNGGTVFSPTPCGKDAKEVNLGTSGKSAAAEHLPADASKAAPAEKPAPEKVDAVRDISDSVDDSHCRRDARNLYVEPDMSAIKGAQTELSDLERGHWTGGTAANRQILTETDRTHEASLRGLIATEQQNAAATRADSQRRVDEALTKCDVRKREVEESRKRGN